MLKIIENVPISFNLWGHFGDVPRSNFGEVGFELMNAMWRSLKSTGVRSNGTNHWVYLDKNRMFVGVGLLDGESAPQGMEHLEFQLHRYAKHTYVGAYQHLPAIWKALMNDLASAGERISGPNLEIYGHQSNDRSKPPETTILIALV